MIELQTRSAVVLALLLVAGCTSLPDSADVDRARKAGSDDGKRQDVAGPTRPADAVDAIAELEDARDDGGGLLEILAGRFAPEVRARAALALGRLPVTRHGRAVTEALIACLGDEVAEVRSTAAFSLGQRGDPAAADALLEHWLDPEPSVRAAIVTAAGRIDDPRLHARVLDAMRSPLEAVRIAAVTAPHRWPTAGAESGDTGDTERIHPEAVDAALAEVASRVVRGSPQAERVGAPDRALETSEVVWHALFALARRRAELGRDAFHAHAQDADSLTRLFAVRGLARIEISEASRAALERALSDGDWRVAVEAARGLGAAGDRRSLDALGAALAHPVFHVRATVVEALGDFQVEPARVMSLLEGAREDASRTVRVAGVVSEAKVSGARVLSWIEQQSTDDDIDVRVAAARAAATLPTEHAEALLLSLSRDANPAVAGSAASALEQHPTPTVHARLVELLDDPDNALRVAALIALRPQVEGDDLEAIHRAFENANGDIAVDVRVNALRTAAAIETVDAERFLELALTDSDPFVVEVANDALSARREARGDELPVPRYPDPVRAVIPIAGEDYDPDAPDPMVEIVTSKGTMLFELFPREAPVHVFNFLELAARDHYDGLRFHRVVSDFVIQGGCYRGDGNGAGTWRAPDDALRQEVGPRPYVRGSLGMPRGEDPESGGSQFFVTHRPTPHLDGLYTIFGDLREGAEVLDAIEVGDTILDVRRKQ